VMRRYRQQRRKNGDRKDPPSNIIDI